MYNNTLTSVVMYGDLDKFILSRKSSIKVNLSSSSMPIYGGSKNRTNKQTYIQTIEKKQKVKTENPLTYSTDSDKLS